jgi:hypothetical protein
MNTYEISWTETVVKTIRVQGRTREEAWEAYRSKRHTKPESQRLDPTTAGIALVNED